MAKVTKNEKAPVIALDMSESNDEGVAYDDRDLKIFEHEYAHATKTPEELKLDEAQAKRRGGFFRYFAAMNAVTKHESDLWSMKVSGNM